MRGLELVIGVPLVLVLAAGCGGTTAAFFGTGDGGSAATSTSDGGTGGLFSTGGAGDGGGPPCAHACVPDAPAWFEDLSMFWIGPPEEAPPCPADVAPLEGSTGYADLEVAPHTCPVCSCSPAACALPEAMHASAAKCPGDGAPSIAWDGPPAWEGGCTAEDPVPAGLVCSGVPCVQSLTIAAPTVEPCTPSVQGDPSFPPPSWGLIARECKIGPLSGEGCATGKACAPAPPEGFTLCVYRYGAHPALECPDDYPRRVDVFAGLQDDRACEPCACSRPDGECAALVSAYSEGACGALIASYTLTSATKDGCVDLPPGVALGSKEAVLTVDQPGTCTPGGGAATGAILPAEPVLLCCLPEPDPTP